MQTQTQTLYPFNWAEDAFNALNDKPDPYAPLNAFSFDSTRVSTPSLLSDITGGKTTSPQCPPTPTQTNSQAGSFSSDKMKQAAEAGPSPKRRKSTRQAQRKEDSTADSKSIGTSTKPAQTQGSDPQTNKRRRGRPTQYDVTILGMNSESTSGGSSREIYLEKNRRAAHRCRERKKVEQEELCRRAQEGMIHNVELRKTVFELQGEALKLKNELLRHASCGGAVEEYINNRAQSLAGASQRMLSPNSTSRGLLQSPVQESFFKDAEGQKGMKPNSPYIDSGRRTFGSLSREHIDGGADMTAVAP